MPKQTQARSYPSLIRWREEQELSQHEAADLLGISQASYARFEQRKRFVKGELAKRLMERTRVPLEVLTGVSA